MLTIAGPGSRLRMLAGGSAVLMLGVAALIAQSMMVPELALEARQAIASERFGPADAADVLRYVASLLFIPLALLGGLVAVERLYADPPGEVPGNSLLWVTHALFATIMIAFASAVSLLGLTPEPLFKLNAPANWLERLAIPAMYLLWLLIADLLFYWLHRAQHRFAWLWKFHAVHHSHTDLSVLRNVTHPIESMLRQVLIYAPLGLLVGFDLSAVTLLAAFALLQTKLSHMRAPINLGVLGHLLVDNRFHFIHHSRDPADYGCNYADRFPFIDRLFGTYKAPGDRLCETGLPDREAPHTIVAYVLATCDRRHSETDARCS